MADYYVDSTWTGGSPDGTIDNPYTNTVDALTAAAGTDTIWYRRIHNEALTTGSHNMPSNTNPMAYFALRRYNNHVDSHAWNSDAETGRPKIQMDDGSVTSELRADYTTTNYYFSGLQFYHSVGVEGRGFLDDGYGGWIFEDCWFRSDDPPSQSGYIPRLQMIGGDVIIKDCDFWGEVNQAFSAIFILQGAVRLENSKFAQVTYSDDGCAIIHRGPVKLDMIGCSVGEHAHPGSYGYNRVLYGAIGGDCCSTRITNCQLDPPTIDSNTSYEMPGVSPMHETVVYLRSGDSTDHLVYSRQGRAYYDTTYVYSNSSASIKVELTEYATSGLSTFYGVRAIAQHVYAGEGTYSGLRLYCRQTGFSTDTDWSGAIDSRIYYWDYDGSSYTGAVGSFSGIVPSGDWGYISYDTAMSVPSGAGIYVEVYVKEYQAGAAIWFDERPRLYT